MIKEKKRFKVIKEKKKTYLSTFFIDLEGRVSFAYVPVRNQNLVVRGRNRRLICFVFFISFEKVLKWKAKWQVSLFVFFNLKEK